MKYIRPITDLRKTNEISDLVHAIDEPLFITKNGYGDLVVMSLEYYNCLVPNSLTKSDLKSESNYISLPKHTDMCMGFIKVAAVSLNSRVANVSHNTSEILFECDLAYSKGAKIIVFPELSVTSYTCGDLFLNHSLIKSAENAIGKIAKETKDYDALIIIGAPIIKDDKLFNCAVVINKGKILGVVPKSYIPNYQEFYEGRYFTPAPKVNSSLSINGKLVPFGTNLIFQNINYPIESIAIEICEDIWVSNCPSINHALGGATIICNLSASNEVIGKEEYRLNLVKMASAKEITAYIYAGAGPSESTTDLIFSGTNIIAENGTILAKSPLFSSSSTIAEIDVERLQNERLKMTSYSTDHHGYHIIPFETELKELKLDRVIPQFPFIPKTKEVKLERYRKILLMQALGLKKRIEHTSLKKLVIGLSGGLDSTLALLVLVKAADLLKMPRENIIAITMPCFGTSDRTYNNALSLSSGLSITLKNIDISKAVNLHLKDIEHPLDLFDVTYENAQARERTQILMDYANKVQGLVVGTGDLSEMALGWSTYNGDHMSMYGVNCSIPKTLIRDMIAILANDYPSVKETLLNILDTPVSPELLPSKNHEMTQITEDIVGPYELHDFFLYYFIRYNFGVKKIFYLAKNAFFKKYSDETIKKWLTFFIKRFFSQQFKRSCTPDGVKVGTISLSPRGDWRMPSDAEAKVYLEELEDLV